MKKNIISAVLIVLGLFVLFGLARRELQIETSTPWPEALEAEITEENIETEEEEAGQTEEEIEPEEPSDTETEIDAAKQAKLAAINPAAYGEIEGLKVEGGTYFSIIGKNNHTQYWMAVKEGAQAAINDLNEALGLSGSDKLKFVYSAPSATDQVTEQVNILDEELARYPAALGIAMIDSKSCLVQFDLAYENGIPIITFDSASTYQGTMANISTDNPKAAAYAAKQMAEALGNKGKVLVFSYDSKSVTSHERVDSFVEEMEKNHPDIELSEVYYLDQFDDLKAKMAEKPEGEAEEADYSEDDVYSYIFEQNPDINGIYATNGATVVKMADLCKENGRDDIVIMGYDADDNEIAAMREGRIAGLIAQNPYGMGYAAIVAEARCIMELANEAYVDTGFLWVTPENLDTEEIQNMLY